MGYFYLFIQYTATKPPAAGAPSVSWPGQTRGTKRQNGGDDAMALRGVIGVGPLWFGSRPPRGASAATRSVSREYRAVRVNATNRVETFDPTTQLDPVIKRSEN